jgi:hypothetical protein
MREGGEEAMGLFGARAAADDGATGVSGREAAATQRLSPPVRSLETETLHFRDRSAGGSSVTTTKTTVKERPETAAAAASESRTFFAPRARTAAPKTKIGTHEKCSSTSRP